jgi:hypothetical protein
LLVIYERSAGSICDGEDVGWEGAETLVSVLLKELVGVDGQVLVGIDRHQD